MKEFNNIEEIKKYYNKNTNTYEFIENGVRLYIKFNFNLDVSSNIKAYNIDAYNIDAYNIDAGDIKACNIDACNIEAYNIKADDIKANDIKANDIEYYAFCIAYKTLKCKSIKGIRENSKHFCLDNKIEYKIDKQTINIGGKNYEITEELKEVLKKLKEEE